MVVYKILQKILLRHCFGRVPQKRKGTSVDLLGTSFHILFKIKKGNAHSLCYGFLDRKKFQFFFLFILIEQK